jgi:hypothetical protein
MVYDKNNPVQREYARRYARKRRGKPEKCANCHLFDNKICSISNRKTGRCPLVPVNLPENNPDDHPLSRYNVDRVQDILQFGLDHDISHIEWIPISLALFTTIVTEKDEGESADQFIGRLVIDYTKKGRKHKKAIVDTENEI